MMRVLLTIAILCGLAAAAGAQSLAELAKQEEARRKAIKTPSKVITNDDLKRYGPVAPASAPVSPAPAATPAAGAAAPKEGAPAEATTDKATDKNEDWWRGRITEAREKVDRNKALADSLQARIDVLLSAFVGRDDPAQRAVIADERGKALAELQRVKDELAAATKLVADIEEEARVAGVPPGWLR